MSSSGGTTPAHSARVPSNITDESLATQFTTLALCLLEIPPPLSPPPLAAIEGFFSSLIPPAAVTAVLKSRVRRSDSRSQALITFGDILEKFHSTSVRVETLRSLAPHARGRYRYFMLDDLVGSSHQSLENVRRAFAKVFDVLAAAIVPPPAGMR